METKIAVTLHAIQSDRKTRIVADVGILRVRIGDWLISMNYAGFMVLSDERFHELCPDYIPDNSKDEEELRKVLETGST